MPEQSSGEVAQRTVFTVIIGAWKESIEADGLERVILVTIWLCMTIPFFPFWVLLRGIEAVGYFDADEGFHL